MLTSSSADERPGKDTRTKTDMQETGLQKQRIEASVATTAACGERTKSEVDTKAVAWLVPHTERNSGRQVEWKSCGSPTDSREAAPLTRVQRSLLSHETVSGSDGSS